MLACSRELWLFERLTCCCDIVHLFYTSIIIHLIVFGCHHYSESSWQHYTLQSCGFQRGCAGAGVTRGVHRRSVLGRHPRRRQPRRAERGAASLGLWLQPLEARAVVPEFQLLVQGGVDLPRGGDRRAGVGRLLSPRRADGDAVRDPVVSVCDDRAVRHCALEMKFLLDCNADLMMYLLT